MITLDMIDLKLNKDYIAIKAFVFCCTTLTLFYFSSNKRYCFPKTYPRKFFIEVEVSYVKLQYKFPHFVSENKSSRDGKTKVLTGLQLLLWRRKRTTIPSTS